MKIILTIKAFLNYLYNNLIDLVWTKVLRFSDGTELTTAPKSFKLFDIKVMAQRVSQKDWSCISYPTQNKLNKTDVPTAYEFLKEKFDNVDGTMSEPTLAGGKIQLYFNGYYYWTDGSNIKRSQYVDLSLSETWNNNIGLSNAELFLLEFDNVTYVVAIAGSYIVLLDTTGTVVKTEQLLSYYSSNIPLINQRLIVINNNAYIVYLNGRSLKILKITSDLTISEIFSLSGGLDTTFYKGITPSLGNGSDNYYLYERAVSCGFDNKIYWARAGLVFWYDLETNTYDYYESILPYGCEVYYDYGNKYRDWGFRLFVYNEKLSILSVSSDGKTLYLMQLNNGSWELVKTIDISSNPIYIDGGLSNGLCGVGIENDYYHFIVIDKNNTRTYKDYKTTNFDNNNFTTIITDFTSGNRLSDLIFNPNKEEYIYTNMLGQYVYTGYVLTVYTDTINGIDIKYYKNGDWKICTPNIAVGNDDNLQAVYEYLGYLNYWWIDTTEEKITLQRNSNMWTFMYVGDDYDYEVENPDNLPSGNAIRLLPQKNYVEDTIETNVVFDEDNIIQPNTDYVFGSLTSLEFDTDSYVKNQLETTIQFTTGPNFSFTDNSNIKWSGNGVAPLFETNTVYSITIRNGFAIVENFGLASQLVLTQVGSLTINHGVVSNFSRDNYLVLPNNFLPQTNTWAIVTKINLSQLGQDNYIYDNTSKTSPGTGIQLKVNSLNRIFSSMGPSGTNWIIDSAGSTTLIANKDYWIKYEYTGTEYNIYLSETGLFAGEETLEISVQNSVDYVGQTNLEEFRIGSGSGRISEYNAYLHGSIDIYNSYIVIGGIKYALALS